MTEKGCDPGMGMEMMKKMMEGQGSFSLPMMERWMQMCEQMTGTVIEIGRLAGFASPELRGLFEEWIKALEGEIVDILKDKGSCPPADLAAQLKLSEESVLFLIGKLVREGKLKINGVTVKT